VKREADRTPPLFRGELRGKVVSTFEDEGMVPIAIEAVASAKALVNEKGLAEPVGEMDGGIKSGIFVGANGVVEPEKDKLTAFGCWRLIEQTNSLGKLRRK
jgi:hypothetical protein